MLDKIIIGLLVLAFPLTAFFSYKFLLKEDTTVQEEAVAKIDQLIAQMQQQIDNPVVAEPKEEIKINTVFYATESGELKVSGFAPKNNVQLFLSAVPNQVATEPTEEASDSAETSTVLGQAVEVHAISVGSEGVFTFDYPVDEDWTTLELRLEQSQASKTILYNFTTQKFEQL